MPQRSPIIFWLLLAATLAVDVVVASWIWSDEEFNYFPLITFHALILAQLSLICIRSTANDSETLWIRFAPAPAAIVAALATTISYQSAPEFRQEFVDEFAFLGFHAASVVIAIWLLQRTKFWSRHTGISRIWQFSMANLLVAMTAVAILAPFLRNSQFFVGDEQWPNLLFAFSSVALTIVSLMIWMTHWFWPLRLAGVLGFALVLVGTVPLAFGSFGVLNGLVTLIVGAMYLIQGVVLSIWLASGYIIPQRAGNDSASSPLHPGPANSG